MITETRAVGQNQSMKNNMPTLEKMRQERDEAFGLFMKHAQLETKNSLKARKFRHLYMLANEEMRAMERDLLAASII